MRACQDRQTSFRIPKQSDRSRARTPEDKLRVREAFIAIWTRVIQQGKPVEFFVATGRRARLAVRPGAIYEYFADQRDLLASVPEMHQASRELEKAIARTGDPMQRVRKLFSPRWTTGWNTFSTSSCSFPRPATAPSSRLRAHSLSPARQWFRTSWASYYDSVREMFDTLPRRPVPPRLATDLLLPSDYGTLAFPLMPRTMEWSDTCTMAPS